MNKKKILIMFAIIVAVAFMVTLLPKNTTATKSATEITAENESPLMNGQVKLVTGLRDDIFAKLKESAEMKVVFIMMRYCVKNELDEYSHIETQRMYYGDWFDNGYDWWLTGEVGEKTTSLWLSNLVEPSAGATLADGAVYCSQGDLITDSDWRFWSGVAPIYSTYVGKGYNKKDPVHVDETQNWTGHRKYHPYKDIVCQSKNGKYYSGLFERHLRNVWGAQNGLEDLKFDPGCEGIGDTPTMVTDEDIDYLLETYPEIKDKPGIWEDIAAGKDYHEVIRNSYLFMSENTQMQYALNRSVAPYAMNYLMDTYDRYVFQDSKNFQLSGFHNGNQYLPVWDEHWSYNNVDGYFNYVRDLNIKCGNHLQVQDVDTVGYDPITNYTQDDLRIVAKKRWYDLDEAIVWDYPLSQDNPVTDCWELIERIEWLRNHPNGGDYIYRGDADDKYEYEEQEKNEEGSLRDLIGYAKDNGYEGIILAALQDACNNMIDAETGGNAYEVLLEKLKDYVTYPGVSEDDIATAEEAIKKIEDAKSSGTFMVSSGTETEPSGKVYECLDVAGLEQILDAYVPPSTVIQEEENLKDKKYNCYSNAGPLGWILCPIIEGLRAFIVEMYGQWVAPALQIDPVLFGGETDEYNQTYQAWAIFRDIGNFLFILLFIFVIFSQISGIGIDNYNIKKMLPKIIIAVVMINLSYIICQVAVDLCNIVGNQIGGFLKTITTRVQHPSVLETSEGITIRANDRGSWGDVDSWGTSFKQNWLGNSMLVIVVAGLGIGAFLYKGLAVIIPVLMMVLSCAISVLGLIIILGLRQAAAVVLVVASPLAMACYMLPNTKSIFDRWFKAFEGLLVAFPICSLVVYGSDLAATILVRAGGNGNTWVIISAAIISIAPIFIIPKVIRKSVAGISGIVTGATNKVKGRAVSKSREKLQNTRLGDRQRYNDNMRAQKRKGAVGAYNAKRGAATLRRSKYQNPTSLRRARDKRTYNAALAAVNAENASAQDAFENQFGNQDDMKIMSDIHASIQNGGKMNINMVVAGLNRMTNDGNAIAMLRSIAQTKEYKDMLKDDPQANQRIAEAMMGRRGNIIAQSMGKLMAKGEDVTEMFNNGSLRDKVQGAGTSVMASQSKDAFNMEGAENLFSDDQIRAGLAAGYGGDTDRAFGRMLQRIQTNPDGTESEKGNERMDKIVGELTGEQVSKMTETGFNASGGADRMTRVNQRAINQLNAEDGKNFRNNMNVKVGKALHIKDVGKEDPTKAKPADSSSTPTPAPDIGGGDPAPVDVDIPH